MSDQIITDLPLIGRYARSNEDEDWRFRAFLKGNSSLTSAELNSIVKEETDFVWSQIDCTKCANCCKTMQVVVDAADIRRLAKRLKVGVQEFTDRYVAVAREDGAQHFKKSPCTFLANDGKCTVYEDRPKACQDFPYLHKDFRSRSISMVSNRETCPIVFNVWQRVKRRFWRRSR